MGKLVAVVGMLVLALGGADAMGKSKAKKAKKKPVAQAQQLFSCNPDPPCRGKPVKITYDGDLPVSVTVTFTPGTSKDYTITTNPLKVEVPADAGSLNVVDNSGASTDLNRAVADC